jgi:hypothetical protein
MFLNKNSAAKKEFYQNFRKTKPEISVMIMIWITMYGFLKQTIDENVIKKLKIELTLNEDMEDLIYWNILMLLKTNAFEEYNIKVGIDGNAFKMFLFGAFLCRNSNDITGMGKAKNFPVFDKNPDIAFDQIMAKIYSDSGKEYLMGNAEIKREFIFIIDSFAKSACIGFKRISSAEITHKKMIQIIDNSTDGVASAFNLGLLMVQNFK